MSGNLISIDDLIEESSNSNDALQELAEDMAALGIADRDAKDTVQRKEGSLLSRLSLIKLPLVMRAMNDALKGNCILSCHVVKPSNTNFIISSSFLDEEGIHAPRY